MCCSQTHTHSHIYVFEWWYSTHSLKRCCYACLWFLPWESHYRFHHTFCSTRTLQSLQSFKINELYNIWYFFGGHWNVVGIHFWGCIFKGKLKNVNEINYTVQHKKSLADYKRRAKNRRQVYQRFGDLRHKIT